MFPAGFRLLLPIAAVLAQAFTAATALAAPLPAQSATLPHFLVTTAPPTAPNQEILRVFGGAGAGVPLRTAPSHTAPVVATVDDGTQVAAIDGPVQADGGRWWKISGPVGTGWARGDQLGS